MLKKFICLFFLGLGIALPNAAYPIQLFGKNIPHIDVQHTMEPLSMDPITVNQESFARLIDHANMSITGTICTAAGAYLFSKGITHALCNNNSQNSKASAHSWKDRIITTLSGKYSQGMITSLVGSALFLSGLYIIGHNNSALDYISSY